MGAAPVTTMSAPIQTISAPMTTMSAARGQVAPRDLKAMGNIVSERVIAIEELAGMDRYAAVEAVAVQAPRQTQVQQQRVVQTIQQPQVTMATQQFVQPAMTTIGSAPVTYGAAPMTIGAAAPMTTMAPRTVY